MILGLIEELTPIWIFVGAELKMTGIAGQLKASADLKPNPSKSEKLIIST